MIGRLRTTKKLFSNNKKRERKSEEKEHKTMNEMQWEHIDEEVYEDLKMKTTGYEKKARRQN
jgi:hypothetical protein